MPAQVPHPGPLPEEFAFPFAEAQRALAAIDAAVQRSRATADCHGDAAAHAQVDFAGQTSDQFGSGSSQVGEALQRLAASLDADRDMLQDDIDTARRLRDASLDALALWEQVSALSTDP